MLHRILIALALTLLASPALALPALHVDGNGKLTGASGVEVAGGLYDVSLEEGSCALLFEGCSDTTVFTFATSADALGAAQALLEQVLINGPLGSFQSDPTRIAGCALFQVCFVNTPFEVVDGSAKVSSAFVTTTGSGTQFNSALPVWNTESNGQHVYAVWSQTAAPMPEPNAATLFLLGFLSLGWARQRRPRAMGVAAATGKQSDTGSSTSCSS